MSFSDKVQDACWLLPKDSNRYKRQLLEFYKLIFPLNDIFNETYLAIFWGWRSVSWLCVYVFASMAGVGKYLWEVAPVADWLTVSSCRNLLVGWVVMEGEQRLAQSWNIQCPLHRTVYNYDCCNQSTWNCRIWNHYHVFN